MSRIRVKICGLTRVEDVLAAVRVGADAIGFVFTASPRRVSVETAIRLSSYVPAGVSRVGLFLDQDRSEIQRVVDSVALDLLQFHGSESEQQCSLYKLPWLKAVAMENAESVKRAELAFPGAAGLLLDSHSKGGRGGSGESFDWSLSKPVSKAIWLAGGLNPNNVGLAIQTVRPFAVDVSSGVETEPGIKDAALMNAFVAAVREAESQLKG